MSDINRNAILAMCAITITIYAVRNSEAHYLPDLLGLALALAAPRQSLALAAWLVVTLVRHSPLALALAPSVPSWLLVVLLPRAYFMTRSEAESTVLESVDLEQVSTEESNSGNAGIRRPVAEKEAQIVISAKAEIMALAVLSGQLGKTEATQIAAGARSGRKYSRWKRLIDLEIERQRNHYPAHSNLTKYE